MRMHAKPVRHHEAKHPRLGRYRVAEQQQLRMGHQSTSPGWNRGRQLVRMVTPPRERLMAWQ